MKASVLMITYNQERYVAQAIESALNQNVDFDYEIVIGEDCSTDGTRDIVIDYQRRNPDIIRLLLPDRNLGMMRNWLDTLQSCRGDYIAVLEGDDYWTSPDKLAQQVKFLDRNPEFSACGHAVQAVDEEGQAVKPPSRTAERVYTTSDLLEGNRLANCSTVLRNGLIREFPSWFYEIGMGDWPLHILNSCHGDIKYSPNVMSAYRVHAGGVWSSKSEINRLKEMVKVLGFVDDYLDSSYHSLITDQISRLRSKMMLEYDSLGDSANATQCAYQCLRTRPLQFRLYRYLARIAFRRCRMWFAMLAFNR